MSDLKRLKLAAKGFSILYVEDNNALRENATTLLRKVFDTVENAIDGKDGLEKFKHYHYDLLITDIKMPNMDGMTLSAHIRKIQPQTKIIVMSAFDDKEYLFQSIELGIYRFLKKPVNLTELTDVLYSAVQDMKHERHTKLFYTHLKSIFNYQSSMVMMLHDDKPILANQIFLDFFAVDTIEDFRADFNDLGKEFMPHDGFLYNHDDVNWFDVIRLNENKLFHIKIKKLKNNIRHFIIKYQQIPEKVGFGILSFDDVTELNLLKLFDARENFMDEKNHDEEAMYKLLEVIQRNSSKIELHNYYKGLSITNDAIISEVKEDSLVVKTSYLQEKAIQYEKRTIIESQALPQIIFCDEIVSIEFDKQVVEFKNLRFSQTSPISRKTIRVIPEQKQMVSLFMGENKFHGDIRIEDISLDAVRLKLNALPLGLEKGAKVTLDIVLELDKKPLIVNTRATLLKKREMPHGFSLVFVFENTQRKGLVEYITKCQMSIIREFKGLQNG